MGMKNGYNRKIIIWWRFFLQEYDHPHILLQNSYSQFTSLVRETGPGMYDQLVKVAKQSYVKKYRET